MSGLLHTLVWLVVVALSVFPVLALGGLVSAWFEVRAERRAGIEPTRPGWEARDKLRARRRFYADRNLGNGGRLLSLRLWYRGVKLNAAQCWCGFGPLLEYPAEGAGTFRPAGFGCVACENDYPLALMLHDEAGGYSRAPRPVGHRRLGRAA